MDLPTNFRERRDKSRAQARTKATGPQWEMCEIAVRAFINKYPAEFAEFIRLLKIQRCFQPSLYGLATKEHKKLRTAEWRNVLSFPVILNERGEQVDSLLSVIKKIIPNLTHKDSVNMAEFIRRFPYLCPAEKY